MFVQFDQVTSIIFGWVWSEIKMGLYSSWDSKFDVSQE